MPMGVYDHRKTKGFSGKKHSEYSKKLIGEGNKATRAKKRESTKKDEELVLWVCMRDIDQVPIVKNSQRAKCAECNHDVWYDPSFPKTSPAIKEDTKKVCLERTLKLAESDDTDVKWRFPHRDN